MCRSKAKYTGRWSDMKLSVCALHCGWYMCHNTWCQDGGSNMNGSCR